MPSVHFVVGIVLGTFAVVAAADSNPTTWLRDYMAPANQAKSSIAGHHEMLEKKTACFRQVNFCHVKCNGAGSCRLDTFTDYSNLACTTCPEDLSHERYYRHHEDHDEETIFTPSDLTLSKCFMHKVRHDAIDVVGRPGVSLVGTFTGVCQLNGGNDRNCDIPEGCDDVEVTITGYVYTIDQAVMVGPAFGGAPRDIPNVCRNDATGPIRQVPGGDAGKVEQPAAEGHHAAKIQRATNPTPVTPVVGKATVYAGPFNVHSYSHPLTFQRGYFQFSFFSDEDPFTGSTEGMPRLGDETYKFEFINERLAQY